MGTHEGLLALREGIADAHAIGSVGHDHTGLYLGHSDDRIGNAADTAVAVGAPDASVATVAAHVLASADVVSQ